MASNGTNAKVCHRFYIQKAPPGCIFIWGFAVVSPSSSSGPMAIKVIERCHLPLLHQFPSEEPQYYTSSATPLMVMLKDNEYDRA